MNCFCIENPILCDDNLPELVGSMETQKARLLGVAHCIVPQQILDPSVMMQPPITLQKMMKSQSLSVAPNLLQPMEPPPSIVQILVPATLLQQPILNETLNNTTDIDHEILSTTTTTTTTTTTLKPEIEEPKTPVETTQGLVTYEEPNNETDIDQNSDDDDREDSSDDTPHIVEIIEPLKEIEAEQEMDRNMIPEVYPPVLAEILPEVLPQPQRAQALNSEVEDPPEELRDQDRPMETGNESLQDTYTAP